VCLGSCCLPCPGSGVRRLHDSWWPGVAGCGPRAGGCITYQFRFVAGAAPSLAIPIDTAIAFEPRPVVVGWVRRTEPLALCGRGAACPG
jgi:hypothetical protein